MVEITPSGKDVWPDGPASAPYHPEKLKIRQWSSSVEQGLNLVEAGATAQFDEVSADVVDLTATVATQGSRLSAIEALAASGAHRAEAVVTVTTANVNLAGGGLANGTTHGGYTVATGQRVLVRAQTTGSQNGVYIVPASGAASRATDADSATELLGISVKVLFGTSSGVVFGCVTPGPITVGTTALVFEKIADDSALTASITAASSNVRRDAGSKEPGIFGGALVQARSKDIAPRFASFDSASGTRLQWFAAWKMGANDRLDAIRVAISDEGRSPAPATIEALLYRQPAALASSAHPADISQYELIDSFSGAAAQYFVIGGGLQNVTLPIASKPLASIGERYVYVVRLRDGGGSLLPFAMGWSRHYASDEETFVKGGFSVTTTLTSISAVSANSKVFAEPLSLRTGKVTSNIRRRQVPVDGRAKQSAWTVDFSRVAFSVRPTASINKPGTLGFYISRAENAVYLRLRVFLRPYADGNYGASPYVLGSGANDLMVYTRDYLASSLYSTAIGFRDEEQLVQLDLDGMPPVGRDQIVMFEVTPYLSDRLTGTTMRVAQGPALASGEITLLRGSYATAIPAGAVQTPTVPHHCLLLAAEEGDEAGQIAPPVVDRVQFVEPVEEFQTTTGSVSLPRLGVWTASGPDFVDAATVAVTNVLTPDGVTDTVTLRYNADDALSGRWFTSVTVTRVSDGLVLTAGTHYEVDSPRGIIRGLQNVANFAVTVAYAAYRGRIDLITWSPGSGYEVFPGTARLADPDNWRPRIDTIGSNGRIAVAEVLVHRAGVEVIDKTSVRPGSQVIIGREMEIAAIRDWNRSRLQPILLEMQRGNNITHIAYGDSITAWTQGYQTDGPTNYQITPNGPYRDRKDSLGVQTPDDSLANIGLPGVVEGDGQTHWYGSFNRLIRDRLASRYGVTIDFKNMGVGGTDAGNGGDGSAGNRWGGSNSTRLAAAVAQKGVTGKTLATICFCTNDPDDDQLVNRLSVIARTFIAAGVVPILIGQPALALNATRTVRRQQRNDSRIIRAARSIPCAYVPLGLITHDNRAASGIFRSLQSCAGGVNHPGAYEHGRYADFIDFMCFQ